MDWNYIQLLLGVVHSAQDVDPWFGAEARKELNKIKAAATKPAMPIVSGVVHPKPVVTTTPVSTGERRA